MSTTRKTKVKWSLLSRATVQVLRRVIAIIKTDPHLYDQNSAEPDPDCGGAQCILGWFIAVNRTMKIEGHLDSELRARLFWRQKWPARFRKGMDPENPNTNVPADVAVKRIEHFIKTGGRQ